MIKENILLLCDVPPCKNYTGGLMISQMARFLIEEKHNVFCFCTMNPYLTPQYWKDLSSDIDIKIVERPSEKIDEKNTVETYLKKISKIEKELIEYTKKNHISKIWCPLQGEVLIVLLERLHKKTNIPFVVQIWDPIDWWMQDNSFDENRKKETLKKHDELLKKAQVCITTSKAMSNYFRNHLKIKCTEVMPALNRNKDIDYEKENNNKFIIALTGQIYARDEFDALLTALDKMEWKYNNKEIYFEHYGEWSESYINTKKHSKYRSRIVNIGFFPQKELVRRIAKANLLYCPYFFSADESLKKVSTLSFPSKLITYLSMRVPILLHSPDYSSPYLFLKDTGAAFFINSLESKKIIEVLKKIIDTHNYNDMFNAANKLFDENFTFEIMKKNFLDALSIKYDDKKKLHILEVNNLDEAGRRFNGYDLSEEINNNTIHSAKQIVTYKETKNRNVTKFYDYDYQLRAEWRLNELESRVFGVHSQLSFTSNILKNNDYFKNADLVHYHLIHNTKLSIEQMVELVSMKPSVITIHDLWFFTGRCVYPQECEEWRSGCTKCNYLDSLFPLKQDNCHSLWKLKKKVFEKLDADIIVSTPFMKKMVEESPLTKKFKHVHLIPFGLDLEKFKPKMTKEKAKEKLGIPKDSIVLFFRAQLAAKGTEFIVEALKELKTDKKITLLSCSETGLLNSLKSKYNVIDLGNIANEEMLLAYNACDVFLMPSRGESFGLMAIEAMAMGCPIIIFDNTALPYVTFAPKCGVLVENKNSYKLMLAIKRLIENEDERIKRGKLGRKLAEEHYDIKEYHKKILKVYEDAYERQKYKQEIVVDRNVDYNNVDVQKLDEKLSYSFRRLFLNSELPAFLHSKGKKYDKNYIIDYSNDDVQNLIYKFNAYIYELIQDKDKIQYNEPLTFKYFIYLYKNDRPTLLKIFSQKLSKNKVFFRICKKLYLIGRKIKHILLFFKYNNKEGKED